MDSSSRNRPVFESKISTGLRQLDFPSTPHGVLSKVEHVGRVGSEEVSSRPPHVMSASGDSRRMQALGLAHTQHPTLYRAGATGSDCECMQVGYKVLTTKQCHTVLIS